jgi:WD40 repeat protein
MKKHALITGLIILAAIVFTACGQQPVSAPALALNTATATLQPASTHTPSPTVTPSPTNTATPTHTPTPTDHPGWMPKGAVVRLGKGSFGDLVASPDGSTVAIAATGGVYFADPSTGRIVDFLDTGSSPNAIAFSSDGNRLFTSISDRGVQFWDKTSGNWEKSDFFFESCSQNIWVSPDDSLLFTYCPYYTKKNQLVAWDINKKIMRYQERIVLKTESGRLKPFGLDFSPLNPEVMAVARNTTISLLETSTGKLIKNYYEPNGKPVAGVQFSPDGSKIAYIVDSAIVVIVDSQTFDVLETIDLKSLVISVFFLDDDTLFSTTMNGDSRRYLFYNTTGNIIRRFDGWVNGYDYVAENSIFVLREGKDIRFLEYPNFRVLAEISGFIPSHNWINWHFSNDGNTFLGMYWTQAYFLIKPGSPQNFIPHGPSCPGNGFLDLFGKSGKYFKVNCEDTIKIIEIATGKTVFSKKAPVRDTTNEDFFSHPMNQDDELLALLYKDDNGKYYAEIWEPLKNKKISTFEVSLPSSELEKMYSDNFQFSPQSNLIAIAPRGSSRTNIYDVGTGNLLTSIPNGDPGKGDFELILDDEQMLCFIRRNASVDVFSIETGELLHYFRGLREGQRVGGLGVQVQGMEYFPESKTFVWYYTRDIRNGQSITFEYYTIPDGQKVDSYVVEIPIDKQNPLFDEKRSYPQSGILDVVFHPDGQGKTAVVTAITEGYGWDHNFIYVVDIESAEILKSYAYPYAKSLAFSPDNSPIFDGFMYQRVHDVILKWDVSAER